MVEKPFTSAWILTLLLRAESYSSSKIAPAPSELIHPSDPVVIGWQTSCFVRIPCGSHDFINISIVRSSEPQ